MCLHSVKTKKCKIAEDDIVCYKVLIHSLRSGRYSTPYQYKEVNPNNKIPFVACGIETIFDERDWVANLIHPKYIIGEGFIHTFKNQKDADEYSINLSREYIKEQLFKEVPAIPVFRCIIPKGTRYYVGKDDNGKDGYASKEIIFKEKIEY